MTTDRRSLYPHMKRKGRQRSPISPKFIARSSFVILGLSLTYQLVCFHQISVSTVSTFNTQLSNPSLDPRIPTTTSSTNSITNSTSSINLINKNVISPSSSARDIAAFFQDRSNREYQRWLHRLDTLPILVVGGSDGSGTRGVVETLRTILHVDFIVEDMDTLDVHGGEMFDNHGWPTLVETVFRSMQQQTSVPPTTIANYQWQDLPTHTQILVEKELMKLWNGLRSKFLAMKRQQLKVLSPEKDTLQHLEAPNVVFGIKAPVTMLLVPVLAHVFQRPIKFLHVLRDGRDVALSDNQSPVVKYFNLSYPEDHEQRTHELSGHLYNVRAMQLWSDWNTQVYDVWTSSKKPRQDQVDVEYLALRTEDLMVGGFRHSPLKRLETIQKLAFFVGDSRQSSLLSSKELCCWSRTKIHDRGKSALHQERAASFLLPSSFEPPGQTQKELEQQRHAAVDAITSAQQMLSRLQNVGNISATQLSALRAMIAEAAAKRDSLDARLRNERYLPQKEGRNVKDVTSYDGTDESSDDHDVAKRYGKYEAVFANDTELAKRMYEEGQTGLHIFGYHPHVEWNYSDLWCRRD